MNVWGLGIFGIWISFFVEKLMEKMDKELRSNAYKCFVLQAKSH